MKRHSIRHRPQISWRTLLAPYRHNRHLHGYYRRLSILLALLASVALLAPILSYAGLSFERTCHNLWPVIIATTGSLIIALLVWRLSRELNRLLKRASDGEAALETERDQLESMFIARTQQLEQAQLLRVMELQRLAEFGRLSANLLHDMASPLTAASLSLEQLRGQQSAVLKQARSSLAQLERYIKAARTQLSGESRPQHFAIRPEVEQLQRIMVPLARRQGVTLHLSLTGRLQLHGDPVKFSQLLANLIMNAIDAYTETARPADSKQIEVDITKESNTIIMRVSDWAKGITPAQMPQLFEPFYTTKDRSRGLGIGLAMVKQFVEKDFRGSISVSSSAEKGTQFVVRLPVGKAKN